MPIVITSKKDGFCRCGVSHPAQSTTYPDDKFSKAQLAVLQKEPMLVVQVVGSDNQGGNQTGKPNVGDTVALVQAATTIEELDKLAEGETRKGVTDAIAKRRTEITPPAE